MNPHLSSFRLWLKRYMSWPTIVCVLIVCYVVFSGEHTVFNTIDYDRQIDSLRSCLEAERDTMLYYRDLNQRLSSDRDLMERVVREQYGMKRSTEDVYIFKKVDE